MNFDRKTAFITGATKGIGRAIAESLIDSGASVFICARTRDEIEETVEALSSKGNAAGKLCDVREEDQVRAALESCERRFGGIDILVNNAGMGYFNKTVEETSSD